MNLSKQIRAEACLWSQIGKPHWFEHTFISATILCDASSSRTPLIRSSLLYAAGAAELLVKLIARGRTSSCGTFRGSEAVNRSPAEDQALEKSYLIRSRLIS